ncbi:hypothetical protein TWF102_008411 [Orbilia oligospora]|uniref:Dynamin N-terminal domain-containing protein n=1 Tax=Orbilia oligospora TaxID=2813651 RepID=A0A7C8JC84_ORBOL|nr:hypothetical protein TWF102_008411 [Orbilia oligospora]
MSTDRISALGGGIFGTPPRHKAPSTPRPPRERERTQFDAKSPTSSKNSETHCDESNGDECFHESSSSVSTPQLETEEFHSQTSEKLYLITGDQSSGKSSALEALTGIPLPRSSGLCTRFATEICLRRSPYHKPVIITIKSASGRRSVSSEEQAEIDAFRKVIPDEELATDKFLEILNQASDDMRVPRPGQRPTDTASNERACSDHLLSLELSGPQHAQFSVIDLPGLIRSVANQQRHKDIDLIKKVNLRYIEYKGVSSYAANQEVYSWSKTSSKQGGKPSVFSLSLTG